MRKYRADGSDISTMLLLEQRKLPDRKMLNLIYSYGYLLSGWVFLLVTMTKLPVFYYSSPLRYNQRIRGRSRKGDDCVKNALGQVLWQLCFLATMLGLRYDVIKRKNMIHLVKFLCPCILQIVTSRLWFHPDTTRHIFHRSPKIFYHLQKVPGVRNHARARNWDGEWRE